MSLVFWMTNNTDTTSLMLWSPAIRLERASRFFIRHRSPCVYPLSTCMQPHMTRSPGSSPSIFAYYKWSNTGSGNGLVTRLWHHDARSFMLQMVITYLIHIIQSYSWWRPSWSNILLSNKICYVICSKECAFIQTLIDEIETFPGKLSTLKHNMR